MTKQITNNATKLVKIGIKNYKIDLLQKILQQMLQKELTYRGRYCKIQVPRNENSRRNVTCKTI